MDKAEHGQALKRAMSLKGLRREVVADATGVKVRTVTNWTRGFSMPSERERASLRSLLGEYDAGGDPVETALRSSELVDWRQHAVLSFYQKNLHEQRAEAG